MSEPESTQTTANQTTPTKSQFTVLWLLIITAVAGITFLILARFLGFGGFAPRPAIDETAVLGQGFGNWEFIPLANAADPVSSESTKGKVLLINFWATWCPPCRKELPMLAELSKEFVNNDAFQLITVSCGQQDFDSAKEASVGLLEKKNLDLPTYFDPNADILRAWQERTGDASIPITLVLDREGKTRGFWIGENKRYIGEMEQKIKELLGK